MKNLLDYVMIWRILSGFYKKSFQNSWKYDGPARLCCDLTNFFIIRNLQKRITFQVVRCVFIAIHQYSKAQFPMQNVSGQPVYSISVAVMAFLIGQMRIFSWCDDGDLTAVSYAHLQWWLHARKILELRNLCCRILQSHESFIRFFFIIEALRTQWEEPLTLVQTPTTCIQVAILVYSRGHMCSSSTGNSRII